MTSTPPQIAARTASELHPNQIAYLGPGLPHLIANQLPQGWDILLLGDNGVLAPTSGLGGCILEQSEAAGLVRGGHVDVAVLQAGQVSVSGDLSEPHTGIPGPSRSAEIGAHARRVIAVMELAEGPSAVVERCDGTRVLRNKVDTIVTDLGVFVMTPEGIALSETAPGWTPDDIRQKVEADFTLRPDIREMQFSLPERQAQTKLFPSADDAVADIPDGATVLIDGFGGPGGMAQYLMIALRDHGAKQLTMVSNTAGIAGAVNFGTPPGMRTIDHSILVVNGQIRKAIASFPVSPSPSRPTAFELAYRNGDVELELVPQGTLAERLRAGGFGLAGFYTPTGAGTLISEGKPSRTIDGREQILERAITADFALLRAHKADTLGNLVYRGTSRNFNSVMAPAARTTIVEVDEIVEPGQIPPDDVVTPSPYVQRLVQRPPDFSAYEPIEE